MANAKTRDARAGFEIYLSAGGHLTLEQLNERLLKAGYGTIKQRTLNHYRSLLHIGANRYIPINRFDVARASRAYEKLSSLGRYRYQTTEIPVRARIIKTRRLLDIRGIAVASGDVGVIIHFSNDDLDELRRFKPHTGDLAVLEFDRPSHPVLGLVIYTDLESTPPIVEVEYTGLTSQASLEGRKPVSTQPIQFIVTSGEGSDQAIDVVGRRLYYFFELLEGVRTLVNKAGQVSDVAYYIPPPIVKSLSLASPIQIIVEIPPILLPVIPCLLFGRLARLFIEMRTVWYQGSTEKAKELLLHQELRRKKQETEVITATRDGIRQILPESQITDEEVEEAVEREVLEPIRRLIENGITSIQVGVDHQDPDSVHERQ